MSYIPDTANPIRVHFTNTPNEPNHYYEGFLNQKNKRLIGIFDSVVEETAGAFDNFDMCLDIANRIDEDDGTALDDSITEWDLTVLEKPEVQRYIKLAVLQYLELSRNDMVIAALEDQWDEPEHAEELKTMDKDFEELSEEEFLKKYPPRDKYINYLD